MTDADDFIAAIIDRPADDVPRLVFADFLEEGGDADRAEFIRVQCELAQLPADDPDRPALEAREKELLKAHTAHWVVPGLKGHQEFRRGFVEVIWTTADWLIAAAGRIFGRTPVRELRVVTITGHVPALARLSGLARVEALELTNNSLAVGGQLERLLTDAPLDALTRLTVKNNQLWPESVEGIARSPVAARLTRLDLSGNPIADAGATVLATHPAFANLKELVVRSDELHFSDSIHATGAAALARSRTLTGLRVLDLGAHYIGDAGLIDLVRSPNSAGLVELDVSYNDIGTLGERAVEELVASPHLGRLRRLNLGGNHLNRLAVAELVRWPRLRDGVQVDLRDCELDADSAEAILRSPFAAQFRVEWPTA